MLNCDELCAFLFGIRRVYAIDVVRFEPFQTGRTGNKGSVTLNTIMGLEQ